MNGRPANDSAEDVWGGRQAPQPDAWSATVRASGTAPQSGAQSTAVASERADGPVDSLDVSFPRLSEADEGTFGERISAYREVFRNLAQQLDALKDGASNDDDASSAPGNPTHRSDGGGGASTGGFPHNGRNRHGKRHHR